jgi:hypothetical protein
VRTTAFDLVDPVLTMERAARAPEVEPLELPVRIRTPAELWLPLITQSAALVVPVKGGFSPRAVRANP